MVDPAVERNLQDVSPLIIMKLPSEEQEIVAVSCFPDSIVDPANTFTMTNEDVMQNMQTGSRREVGGVPGIHNEGHRLLKVDCFETSILAEGRDSGAPMFSSNGFLVGLVSTSWQFEEGLPNSLCVSVLELADTPIGGKPVRELWTRKPKATAHAGFHVHMHAMCMIQVADEIPRITAYCDLSMTSRRWQRNMVGVTAAIGLRTREMRHSAENAMLDPCVPPHSIRPAQHQEEPDDSYAA
jgi:hypothetical protein